MWLQGIFTKPTLSRVFSLEVLSAYRRRIEPGRSAPVTERSKNSYAEESSTRLMREGEKPVSISSSEIRVKVTNAGLFYGWNFQKCHTYLIIKIFSSRIYTDLKNGLWDSQKGRPSAERRNNLMPDYIDLFTKIFESYLVNYRVSYRHLTRTKTQCSWKPIKL